MDNIHYYNKHAKKYIETTFQIDMTHLYDLFTPYVPKGGTILDLGCGSGRDSLQFNDLGYEVVSLDASIEMVKHCTSLFEHPVIHASFLDYQPKGLYDGIWASASLLHVSQESFVEILNHYSKSLRRQGVFYISLKESKEDFSEEERSFTGFTHEKLLCLLKDVPDLELITIKRGKSLQDKLFVWLSLLLQKK